MLDAKLLEQLVSAVAAVLPRTPQDFERNARAALQSVLDRLDLVTREELEVQEAVLARTRARVAEMEKTVTELEKKLASR